MAASVKTGLGLDLLDLPIQVQHLCKQYGSATGVVQGTESLLRALNGISFEVARGEIFGLIGPDGAGKTTTFQILAGVMEASGGQVSILGASPRQVRTALGYVPQKFSLYPDLSVAENLRYSAGLRQVPETDYQARAQALLERVDLARFSDRLAGQLSGGMKQKLALCCALVTQPQVLLLDEPTTGVDPVSRREFWDLLAAVAAEGVTIVVATPYLDEAERCHRIGLIYRGEIQELGTLGELRASLGLQRLEVRLTPLEQGERRLRETPSETIVDIQPFGDRLDVLVTDPVRGEAQIRSGCEAEGLRLEAVRRDDPTLENVFVHRLRQQGMEPPDLPFPADRSPPAKGAFAIETHHLQKNFGSFTAVQGVNLTIRYGDIYGLLGGNGAGKTTTIKMLCGLLPATSGRIQLGGETQNLNRSAVRSRIGYMSQKFTLYNDLTIAENLEFYCGVYGVPAQVRRQKIEWVLATCGLKGKENLMTGSLPGGWKQRVSFGASVMHEPDILFLDEPTSGVDPLARRQFWRLIRRFAQRGVAILVTTHYLEEAENCNQMAFMVGGAIVAQGSPSDIKQQQPGQLLELKLADPQQGSDLLKAKLPPWRVSIFGDRLHLVLDHPDTDLPRIQAWLDHAQIQLYAVRPIPFSLEDAFIGITQRSPEV
jgi:ABC-2 type transport system ATP-binding protein